FLGVGAIDQFSFGEIKTPTQDKLYTLYQVPSIRQRSYTSGVSYRRSVNNGYYFVSGSRNVLDNRIQKYDGNEPGNPSKLRYKTDAVEAENKLRLEVNKYNNGWTASFGGELQYDEYDASNNIRRRAAVNNQPEERLLYSSNINFLRYGVFAQAGKKFYDDRLSVSIGARTDMNTFSKNGTNPAEAFSPRLAISYLLSPGWTINGTIGRYARLVPYTILGFRDNNNQLVNKTNNYITNTHYVAGLEFMPKAATRFTVEGFYKKYSKVPVTIADGISINNQGADFNTVGNEAVISNGKGEAYGLEFFAQQKLTKRFFGFFSYTFFYSRFSNSNGKLLPSSWDNRHLVSLTFGYKLPKNWELGMKYRYQGGAPFTPFNMELSQKNFLTQGQGLPDYTRINSQRLDPFSVSDLRLDKKWNFKRITLDAFLDVTNWFAAKSVSYSKFSLERNLETGAFVTTDGQPVRADAGNAIPLIIRDEDPVVLPTIGFIIEF
ncbi:MAG: TonB-dependent receptor plug domain-containing protein, partial [Candidatus Dadabacteria bacterium]